MEWSNIIEAYQLQPEEIEQVTERVFKIKANSQQYALKRSRLYPDDLGRWQAIQQFIQQKQILGFVPLYYAENNQLFVQDQEHIYYLMPWVEQDYTDQPIDEYATAIHAVGRLHAATMDYHQIAPMKQNKTTIEQQFQQELSTYRDQMLKYVRYFEAKRFMSPYELQVCMYYRDIEHTFNQLERWQEIYLDVMDETEKMKYTLCHGNIRPSHYVVTQTNTYFLNWEDAFMTSPTYDLAAYYQYLFQFHDCDIGKVIDSFSIYCRYIDLSDYEKALLALQLLSPSKWIQEVSSSMQSSRNKNTVNSSIKIEQEYRRLLFGFQLQEFIYKTLKSEQFEDAY
ncbi:spore coat protein YsxE [Gracilibacillus orientalis]|uniref:Spore coat protein YsxE n=1 Tax=Gracilibacillus orientalis TaxID=334253 RepID=A0A1I4MS74_9BACI|nr:phosphotransferase [Gracilibacillus orientalis]SFM05853.1 spore coat protein YsxE [Gracilibacillus orientalis]